MAILLPVFGTGQESVAESHACRNHFYGGQIGAQADYCHGDWRLTLLSKVALGSVNEQLDIHGTTVFVTPTQTVAIPLDLFTGPNNIGNHNRDRFAVVPEVGVSIGRRLGENLTVSVGYTFLYINQVTRPGDQIDRVVNLHNFNRPIVLFKDTDFWMQGVSFGLEYRF